MEWINIKDRLPSEGTTVLIHIKWNDTPMPAYLSNGEWKLSRDLTDELRDGYVEDRRLIKESIVTHWMFLPDPPVE